MRNIFPSWFLGMSLVPHGRFRTFSRCSAYALIALGLSVFLGWIAQIGVLVTVLPGRIPMKPNTALGFICAGVALLLLKRPVSTPWSRAAGMFASLQVIGVGSLTLIEYLFHHTLGIDQLFFRDYVQNPYPGRMAHITALNFALTGWSLFLLSASEKQARWPQLLSLLSGFSATLGMIGYLYGVPALYGSIHYTSMALHTGLGFILLSAAILHSRPSLGVMQVVTANNAGGWLARRVLPAAVIVPICLGAVYAHNSLPDAARRLAFPCFIIVQVVFFVALVWTLSFLLNRIDTQKAMAEIALERAEQLHEQKYRKMFEEAVIGIFQSTREGKLLSVNPAMASMLGYGSPQEMTTSITDIANQLYADAHRRDEFVALMEEHGAVRNFECQLYRRDTTSIWVSADVVAVHEHDATVRYQGVITDITQRKLLEEQLAQSQKMEAVGRLAGGVAHDFNNAIGVIIGYTALLGERLAADQKAVHYSEQIKKAGHQAASLTRQLLAFSRKQVVQPAVLELNAVVTDTEKMLRRLIGEDINLTVNLGFDLGHIQADRGQIEQVLMNLAVNARDAMPQGGKLVIETLNSRLDATAVTQHSTAKPGDYVVLSVSDTGCGMDKEIQSHLFEPFFTTKPLGKGTGLGLSTVYGIVTQNNGYIWVYSEPGKGARFKIFFPRTDQPTTPQMTATDTITEGSETILLVEDDDAMRELTCHSLESSGYKVLGAANGEQAIQAAGSEYGPIHLLLTDVVMPGISGRQLATSLVAYRHETKVLYMSGYTADLVADHGVLETSICVLEKPFTKENLLRSVRGLLDGTGRAGAAAIGN
jgi:two-component system, cell cycle sensor histidine kinase and response regulator CckA